MIIFGQGLTAAGPTAMDEVNAQKITMPLIDKALVSYILWFWTWLKLLTHQGAG